MIEVSHVTQRFGAVKALDDISLEVERGQIVALVGPSGAGKTTLLRLMSSFLFPSAGEVRLGGMDTRTQSLEVRRMVGYLPERDAVYPEMRVREFLAFRARLKGATGRPRQKRLRELVQRCGLKGLEGALMGNLSKGEVRRVLLAESMVGHPAVLLLDEPTMGLDPANAIKARSLVASAAQEGTVVLSTHDLDEAEALATRVAILNRGRLVAFDAPAVLVAATGGRDLRTAVVALTSREGGA